MMSDMRITIEELKQLPSHPEYGCKLVGEMLFADLREPEQMPGLLESIADSGIQKPLVIEEHESGEQILADGHHRALAAIHLGLTEVPTIVRQV
jgi:hypothetical protein